MSLDKIPVLRITEEKRREIRDAVVTEHSLKIRLNGHEIITLLCSPSKLEYLAAGFLYSEGTINCKKDISKAVLNKNKTVIEVTTSEHADFTKKNLFNRYLASSGGRGTSYNIIAARQTAVDSMIEVLPAEIFNMVEKFISRSKIFKATGGIHGAALCDTKDIIVFSEDIGRHNAIDKVFGECMLRDFSTHDRIIVTSGRISSEIVLKVARTEIPLLISKSAPTDIGVKLADDLGITLVGFVRKRRMNVYTHAHRVVCDEMVY